LAAARKRGAHNGYGELKGRAFFYNVQSKMLWGQEHQVLKDSRLVTDALNLTTETGPLIVNTNVETQRLRERLPFLQSGGDYAVIHPTSRWAFKQWLPERWAAVADWLAESRRWQVVFSSGPDARELAHLDTILAKAGQRHGELRGETTLRELAWIIQRARLFCGVDTVAMHLAAAVQTPTVALFGPSSEWSWRPWRTKHELVLGPCRCKQTRRFVCDKSKPYPCMEAITVENVKEKVLRILSHA
jgi:heptosyltransferase-3